MFQPPPPAAQARASRLLTLIATILVVAVLYFARAVLVPMALALLLCFLLGPLVDRLERWGLGRVPSVIAATVLSFALIGVIGYIATIETISLAQSLPQYRHNIREKARILSAPGWLTQATQSVKEVTEEALEATTQLDPAATQPATATSGATPSQRPQPESETAEPTPVQIAEPSLNPIEAITRTIHPFLGPLGVAGIVIVFVIFMLIQREDLRDRIIAVTGSAQINAATLAIDDAARRVSRYLLMQLIVNVTYGVPVAIGLMLIGVPNAVLWGMLCVVFRYIPYLGPWIGAALPIILSLAVFDDWTRPAMVVGLFVVLELISNNIVEPLLYGSETGVSPVAVLVAAVFWGWLWGIPGLVLATPLTVCLVVLGQYIPQMQWLSVLLGDRPSLPLPARVYQRLLAGDHDEALDLALEHLKSDSLLKTYEQVLMPALSMAETDRHEHRYDDERAATVLAGMRELVEELGEHPDPPRDSKPGDKGEAAKAGKAAAAAETAAKALSPDQPLIAIVAARDEADELVGLMLEQLLTREGQRCRLLAGGTLATETVDRALELKPSAICISAMPPMAVSHARYVGKRLRSADSDCRLVIGVWNAHDLDRAKHRVATASTDQVVSTLADALARLRM